MAKTLYLNANGTVSVHNGDYESLLVVIGEESVLALEMIAGNTRVHAIEHGTPEQCDQFRKSAAYLPIYNELDESTHDHLSARRQKEIEEYNIRKAIEHMQSSSDPKKEYSDGAYQQVKDEGGTEEQARASWERVYEKAPERDH
jgi:hypothetical protein